MKKISILILFSLYTYALDFKIATYNVQNLFDLKNDGTEYKEFIPYVGDWDRYSLKNKLDNISKVILDLDSSIISLQEIESQRVLKLLLNRLKIYKYSYFLKNRYSAIGVAILSKYPILSNEKIKIDNFNKYSRDILKSTIDIDDHKLIIYTNHWRSKRGAENTRIPYAQSLLRDIQSLNGDEDYIILGDLNSNYNEYITFKYNKKLNNTYGITAINDILKTSINGNLIVKDDILKNNKTILYNLWLEKDVRERFSSSFKGKNNTPDNIIIPHSLFDNKNISYIDNSFNIFKPNYLYGKYIYRWNKNKRSGYSDHLPIYAWFSTEKQVYKKETKIIKKGTIKYLYTIQKLDKPMVLKDVVVIYKNNNLVIIKQKKSMAISVYTKSNILKEGYKYDLYINKIEDYNGLKEVTNFSIKSTKEYISNYKELFLDGQNIDMFNLKNQNQIVKINGIYKNNNLYFQDKKIYLYFKKGIKKPKNNSAISIVKGHISIYKSKIQISIHNQSDFKAKIR